MTTYAVIPSTEVIERTIDNLKNRTNINAVVVSTKQEALQVLLSRLPAGAEIMNNQSITLNEIGFTDYLAQHPNRYRNLRAAIIAEPDTAKRFDLRRQASVVDYAIGSVNAVAETGELVFASHGGSQLPAYAATARHVIYVVGAQKIVPTLEDAIRRVKEYAHPLEDKRINRLTRVGKWLIIENEWSAGRAEMIIVKEPLGF